MTSLREAAQQALEAMSSFESGTGGLYEGEFSAEIAALRAALAEPVKDPRICTCHPDDNPPKPCPRKYALGECREAALAEPQSTAEHISSPECWCHPELNYVDPVTGAEVWVHKEIQ